MNEMRDLMERMQRFMHGRYGGDELFHMLAVCYIVVTIVNIPIGSPILFALGSAILIIALYRYFSRNISKRVKENERALAAVKAVKHRLQKIRKRYEQNKTHYFKRCPGCGKTLRLPRVKGTHSTKCPSCGCAFKVKIIMGKK